MSGAGLSKELHWCEWAFETGLAAGGREVDSGGRYGEPVSWWRFAGDRTDGLPRLDRATRLMEQRAGSNE
jgi:hypothetical protein